MPPAPARRWLDAVALLPFVPALVVGAAVLPWPSSPRARFLNGADAGEWALNAQRVLHGDFSGVDPHRPPAFLLAVAAARACVDDIAQAGHLVAAAAWMALPLATYALGRTCGGPLVGALAGLLVLGAEPLLHGASLYSVDPFITTLLPLSVASVALARHRPGWAWTAGLVSGLAAATHLTTLPYWLPALALLMWQGRDAATTAGPWARALLFGSGVLAVLVGSHAIFGGITVDELLHSISEGIARDAPRTDTALALSAPASETLKAGRSHALEGATHALLLPLVPAPSLWLAWVVALWAGIVGLGLAPRPSTAGRVPWFVRPLGPRAHRQWRRESPPLGPLRRLHQLCARTRLDPGTGLILLSTLVPAVLFAAADAPERYTRNLLPFAAVLLARGLASAVRLVGWAVPARARRPVWGGAATLAVAALAWTTTQRVQQSARLMPAPGEVPRAARSLADALQQTFPGDSAIATPMREAAAHLGRPHCPRQSCLGTADTLGFRACVAQLRAACPGEGPLPFVWLETGPVGMGDDAFSQAFGAWAAESWPPERTVTLPGLRARLIGIPRSPGAD